MAKHTVASDIPPSDEERRLTRYLDNAFVYEWKRSGDGRKLVFTNRFPLHEFFDLIMRMGDPGYELGATLFARMAADRNLERAVRSHLMTRLARGLVDADVERKADIKESEVAHFGRFVGLLIERHPEMHVEWAEDMDADDPQHDLRPQPTAVIRGVFLSPSLDQRKAVKFWELAAASPRFPLRIFSDPCGPEEGTIFTSYQQRVFAVVFSLVPEPAMLRFARHMREFATQKIVRRYDEAKQAWRAVSETAGDLDRGNVFRNIAGSLLSNDRRRKAEELFGLTA